MPRPVLGQLARSVAVVGGGTAIGQGVLVLAAPVLARLYDPEAFGLLSLYSAVVLVVISVASLRFDFAVPIASSPDEAFSLLAVSLLVALAISAGLGILVLVWGAQLAQALGGAPLAAFIWLLPLGALAGGAGQALASWAVYQRNYAGLGRVRAIQGLSMAGIQVGLGMLRVGAFGLLFGDVASRVVGSLELLRSGLPGLRSMKLTFAGMAEAARKHWGFAKVMTVASLVSAVSLQVPFLLIPSLFDLEASGQYFLAYRLLVLPSSLVGAAVSQVFLGEASMRQTDPSGLNDIARKVAVTLFVFSIPTYGIVAVAGTGLVETVFGPTWELAGVFTQIMAPMLILWSVSGPISGLLLVGRRERESLGFTALGLVVGVGALVIGAAMNSLSVGLVILTALSVILHISALWRFLRVAAVSLGELVRPVAGIAVCTLPSLALVFVASGLGSGATLLVAAVAGWALAIALAIRFTPESRALVFGSHD